MIKKPLIAGVLTTLIIMGSFKITLFADVSGPGKAQRSRVILLGTGTPFADPDRSGPGVAIIVNNKSYIFDCGPGIVRRASAAARKYSEDALLPEHLERLFITHLHSDHTTGYPDFLLSTAVLDRKGPLIVYGPRGINSMHENIIKAYTADIETRVEGLEKGNRLAYSAIVTEIDNSTVYKDSNITVVPIPVDHGSWKEAYGYKIITPDKTIVLSGDCTYSAKLAAAAVGCDILIHEVYSTTGLQKRPDNWQKYHSGFHTSSRQLAEIAGFAKPGLLVLYHQLYWSANDETLCKEIRDYYKGKFVSGKDLDLYE